MTGYTSSKTADMKPKLPWRLPIAWRLGATAMIGLAGTLVVLISVILGARELRSARDDAVASLQAQTLIGRGRAELAEARERSLRFALAPSTEGVDAVKELIRACEEDFQAIRKMRRFDTLNEKLGLLLDGLSQYLGKFQKVVGLRERIGFIDTQGERDALAQSQRGARREIDRASYDPSPEVAAGKMPVRLLQIESAAKDFLLSKNLKSMIDFRNQEADLLSFIQKAPIESEVPARPARGRRLPPIMTHSNELAQSRKETSRSRWTHSTKRHSHLLQYISIWSTSLGLKPIRPIRALNNEARTSRFGP